MVLEVDMEYPEELHDIHNGYPLAPESKEIKKEMLSDYAREIAEKYNVSVGGIRKLVTSLGPRKEYVVHVRNLKLYMDLGMKLTRVHRAVTFNQSKWLSDYIAYNTKMRSASKNTFEKNFSKLMNNSIYGKTMENVRKRVDVKLVTTKEDLVKVVASPCFQSQRIMNENLVAVKRIKEVLTLSKPCYVGMCILDLSKTLMYDFHYNTIKKVRIDPVVEERGPKEVGPIEEVLEHHTVEKLKVLDEPEIRRVPRAKRVKTMTFAEDDEVEVKLEKHWTPKLELVKRRKRKVSEGECFEVFSEPEIHRVPRAKRVKTMTFVDDEVEVKLEKRRAPKLELVKKRKSKVSKGKCFEVFDKPEIRKVPKAMRATRVTNEYTVEPDRSWLRDHSKYAKDPKRPPSLVEQHEELMAFIKEDNNLIRLEEEEEEEGYRDWLTDGLGKSEEDAEDYLRDFRRESYCEACEDENQSDSPDDEFDEIPSNIVTERTLVVASARRIRKPRPSKLTVWVRKPICEQSGFMPLRA
jgi:hypothetical protein